MNFFSIRKNDWFQKKASEIVLQLFNHVAEKIETISNLKVDLKTKPRYLFIILVVNQNKHTFIVFTVLFAFCLACLLRYSPCLPRVLSGLLCFVTFFNLFTSSNTWNRSHSDRTHFFIELNLYPIYFRIDDFFSYCYVSILFGDS